MPKTGDTRRHCEVELTVCNNLPQPPKNQRCREGVVEDCCMLSILPRSAFLVFFGTVSSLHSTYTCNNYCHCKIMYYQHNYGLCLYDLCLCCFSSLCESCPETDPSLSPSSSSPSSLSLSSFHFRRLMRLPFCWRLVSLWLSVCLLLRRAAVRGFFPLRLLPVAEEEDRCRRHMAV